jgi:hypothetical protein
MSSAPFAGVVVRPVPPLATASVPATVTAPDVAVAGVRPVEPNVMVETPPLAGVAHAAVPPTTVKTWLVEPMARRVELFVPLPMIRSPVVVTGDSALKAAAAVVWPVPPLPIGREPVTPAVRETWPQEGAALVVARRT